MVLSVGMGTPPILKSPEILETENSQRNYRGTRCIQGPPIGGIRKTAAKRLPDMGKINDTVV